jgi:dienelactone hydrolase
MFNDSNKYLQFVIAFLATAFTILQGIDWLLLKLGVEENYNSVLLVILLLSFFIGLFILWRKQRQTIEEVQEEKSNRRITKKLLPYLNVGFTLLLAAFFIFYFQKGKGDKNLLDVKLPEIIKSYEDNDLVSVYRETKKLLDEQNENPIVKSYFDKVTEKVSIYSEPVNVQVSFKVTADSTEIWESIGSTPLEEIQLPYAHVSLKLTLDGKEYTENTHPYYLKNGSNVFVLPKSSNIQANHQIFVGGSKNLSFPGIDHLPNVKIGPYSMARFEVTNKEFKSFVDAGGYENEEYWDFPVVVDGRELSFKSISPELTDKFGKAGPSNWSYGNFPEGQENFPVTGICWYEARAYAAFKKMSLPNLYQWANAALLGSASEFVPKSNFSKNQLVAVGSLENKNPYNISDIAGNVREWVINSVDDENHKKAILGGSYTDDPYFFNDFYGQNALDRSIGNGLRLVQNLEEQGEVIEEPIDEIAIETRDFLIEKKVSDDVFEIFKAQFDYKDLALNTEIIDVPITKGTCKVERFEVSSAYEENGKLPGYVFYDSTQTKPLKPIIYFPGSSAIHLTNTDLMLRKNLTKFNYLLKEGYAVFLPIYLSTYERADELKSDYPNESESYKDHVIKWGKDYKRTIDYIESREDMDISALSYFGVSWGGFMSNILLAIDDRVQNSVLYVAGLCFQRSKNEVEGFHYTSRVTIPVLMLNGKYDQFFPLETSQIPMFKLLGTKEEDKKHYVFETGHFVPKEELIKEHLGWLKRYEN